MATFKCTALCTSLAVLLGACGGGGGDAAVTPTAGSGVSWALSGTIAAADNSAVDSDTNDPHQTLRRTNNDHADAQPLSAPFTLAGTVNLAGMGPPGPSHDAGDGLDGFRVTLQAGQVVELEFNADPSVNDLDLYVLDETTAVDGRAAPVGDSATVGRYECVQITRTGSHYIAVSAYKGASSYTLRAGGVGEVNSCASAVSVGAGVVAGEVVAQAAAGDAPVLSEAAASASPLSKRAAQPSAHRARNLAIDTSGLIRLTPLQADVPGLLGLPSAAQRRTGLARLAALAQRAPVSGRTQRGALSGALSGALNAAEPGDTQSASAPRMPLELREVMDTVHYAKLLARTGLFAYAEPNRWATASTAGAPPVRVGAASLGSYPPNDPLYSHQRWHFEMIGVPEAINRLAAQPLASPITSPITFAVRPLVAIIDNGIVASHPDLAPQIFDARSFLGRSSAPGADEPALQNGKVSFHGTHVAGIVAAAAFDGSGVAGVAPMAQLMPLRVFAPGEDGASQFDIAQALLYAAGLPNVSGLLPPRRADVANLSLGSASLCGALYADVVKRARGAGTLVVAAAGNNYAAPLSAPANCDGVVSVGAVDARRVRAEYANIGASLSVTAPGGDLRQYTTGTGFPDGVYSSLGAYDAAGQLQPHYGARAGTSMATAHVSGVFALMRWANPALTVGQVDALLAQGRLSDDLGPVGRDSSYGAGLINARKAVDEALALAGGSPAPEGMVLALPGAINFGSLRSSTELALRLDGPSSERVTAVVSHLAAITVTPSVVDAVSGLGSYTVTVDRSQLPLGRTETSVMVSTQGLSGGREFSVAVSVFQAAPGTLRYGDAGPVYVLAINPDTGDTLAQAVVEAVNGRYAWRLTGVSSNRVQIMAGTDLDHDSLICQRGEFCGAYPQLSSSITVLGLSGDRSGIDFDLLPPGSVNAGAGFALGSSFAPPRSGPL